jgi:probable phosphoglycerate mutase
VTAAVPQARFTLPAGAAELLLIRHGESAPYDPACPPPLLDGQADPHLDPVGVAEAESVADRLEHEPIRAIYRSPLRRTGETAEPLAQRLGLIPEVVSGLREVFLGEVDGRNLGVLAAAGHDAVRQALRKERWDLLPGAEAQDAFRIRVRSAIETIAARHPGEAVAAFTHGGVIGEVVAIATGASLHSFINADNASVTHLVVTARRWIVRSFNDASHLRAPAAGTPGR